MGKYFHDGNTNVLLCAQISISIHRMAKSNSKKNAEYPRLVIYVTKEELKAFKAKALGDGFRNARLWALCILTKAVK